MNRFEFEQKIVIKALKDPAFKKRLISQPKEAIREFLKDAKGASLVPLDKLDIRVVEEQKNEWVLAIPHFPKEMGDLSDSELEKMAAGTITIFDVFGWLTKQ